MFQQDRPIIAMLTEVSEKDEQNPSFRNIHPFCEELHEYVSKKGGFFYVFTLKNTSKEAVTGFYYDGEKWKKDQMPIPDFVYNRIHGRRNEGSKGFKAFMKLAKELQITVFNQRFLSKWEVHEWLTERNQLSAFLPETYLFTRASLEEMLDTYTDLFIKPLNGSQGRGIYWVNQQEAHISLAFSKKEGIQHQQYKKKEEIIEALIQKIGSKPYLIQQGLELLKWDGNSLDFRALCHRKNNHEWKVTSIVARASAEDHFASNLALGGNLLQSNRILATFFSKEYAYSKRLLMKELAIEAASCISSQMNGLMVELGIDIGIDAHGNLWLIEINSKPSKNLGEQRQRIRPSAKAIIDYCLNEYESRKEGENE